MIVIAVHIGSLVALSSWPSIGRLLPLGVTEVHSGAMAWMAWLVVLGTIAWGVMIRRDLV